MLSRECSDLDIRNEVKNFRKLQGCTVVFGYLQIVLMDNSNNDFTNITFPELREVTGFVLLFRVFGLDDLGRLFPNLIVIRGATLFADYGLIVYGLPDLKRIGLKNLLSIERGFVRIELCPKLCYASTIEWERITHDEAAGNVVPKDPDECPGVRIACRQCPIPMRCWSPMNCQKMIGDSLTKCKNAPSID